MSALSKVAKMMAKAADKGLDVSPQARKARAVEQGYMTNRQLKELVEQVGAAEPQGNRLQSPAYMRMKPPSHLSFMNGPFYGNDGNPLAPELVQLLQDDIARQREEWWNAPATFYHGAAGDFDSFSPNYLGRSTKAASANHATFFSNLPEDADYYAHYAGQTNPRLDRKVSVIKDIADKLTEANKDQARMLKYGAPQVHIDKNKEYISRLHRSMRMAAQAQEGDAAPAVYPVHLRLGDAWPVNKRGEGYGDITKHLSTVKNEGGDSVVFFDINDPNPFATHAAVFDPSRIRSINAMFDPERINSRDLLASMAGAGIVGSGLTDEFAEGLAEQPEKYASGGLVKAGKKVVESIIKDGVEFIKNPTKKEVKQLIEEDPYASARVMRDEEGTVYAFHGNEMLHDEAARLFNVPYDIENPLENSDVIGLYKGKLHALSAPYEDIPHDEWEEWNRRALEMFNLKPAVAIGAGLPALQQYESMQYPYE